MPFFCASPQRVSTFAAGLVLGFCLIVLLGLPLLSAAFEISPPTPKAPSADPDDFIEGHYWALIIGINKYPKMDKDRQLTVARKDAEAVAKLLVERYGFEKDRMAELYDEKATRKEIIEAFNSLKRHPTDKDSLFIYFAGHGEYEQSRKSRSQEDGMGYWIPSDAELDDPSAYIFNSQVREYMANIPARHIFAVIDSAYSNSLMGRSRAFGPNKGLSRTAIKKLYQTKSRWVLVSRVHYPVLGRDGHSLFALDFMRMLYDNNKEYVLASEVVLPCNPSLMQLLPPCRGQLPIYAPVSAAGDEGGQFVFRLQREFRK